MKRRRRILTTEEFERQFIAASKKGRKHLTQPMVEFVFTWTPTLAAVALESSGNIRHLSMQKVDEYAEDLKTGNWHGGAGVDHIVFEWRKDGRLIGRNGQHRLKMLVVSGQTVRLISALGKRGVSLDTKGMDRARPRTVSVNYGVTKEAAAVAYLLLVLEEGRRRPTQAQRAERYRKSSALIDEVLSAMRTNRLTRNAMIACAFCVALERASSELRERRLRRLLEEMRTFETGKYGAALTRLISDGAWCPRGGGAHYRAAATCRVLNILAACADGRPAPKRMVSATIAGLQSFIPDAIPVAGVSEH